MLAISLHAVRDELRDELVPLNKKYPIAELLDACRAYPGLSNARRITFEYVMLKGVNDSARRCARAGAAAAGIPAKINLIPFNPWPGTGYECSDWERSSASPTSSTAPATPRRSARRAAATSSPPAAS
jgi:23S rRNA (adenine2503-C2)-methyltransferase